MSKIITNQEKTNSCAENSAVARNDCSSVSINSVREKLPVFVMIAFICLVTTVAYCPILFNFFSGDDFVHLTWLRQAMENPELILRNFHSSWLDGTTTRFYRPLISLFMVSDYCIWGINGFGFHLTNLFFHLVSTVLIFLIGRKLLQSFRSPSPATSESPPGLLASDGGGRALLIPAFASLFFGVYPLHPEAVSWITGRVDVIVTAFYLLSFWGYLRWRQNKHWTDLLVTVSGMILALLSKEMAIILPATFAAYELLLNERCLSGSSMDRGRSLLTTGLAERLKGSIAPTLVFWLILALYFAVRRWALGTFVGGYDDSLFFISNWRPFLAGWLHGLQMLVVPVNRDFLGTHSIIMRSWEVAMALCCGIVLIKAVTSRKVLQLASFCIVWLMLCLAPVYKLFNIADDLQGSRLAFMATVPLCMFFSLLFAPNRQAKSSGARRLVEVFEGVLATSVLALAAYLLILNNQAWCEAGHESNAIRGALHKAYSMVKGDPEILFLGLPDNRHGAYVCRNALDGMMKKPQFIRDIKRSIMLDRYEPTFPFGFLKKSIVSSKENLLVFRWDRSKAQLISLNLVQLSAAQGSSRVNHWSSKYFKQIMKPSSAGITSRWLSDGTLEVKSMAGSKVRPKIDIDLGRFNCASVDFVAVTVRSLSGGIKGFDLFYKNDFVPDFDLYHRNHCEPSRIGEDETLIFSLHNLPEWVFGGTCTGLQLRLPERCHVVLKSIAFLPAETAAPTLSFAHSDFLGSKGFLHLSSSQPAQVIEVDARNVARATGIVLEITRPNLVFTTQSTSDLSCVTMSELIKSATKASIVLNRKMFPATGQYELRAWAIDSKGHRLGVAGDHIVVCVDS